MSAPEATPLVLDTAALSVWRCAAGEDMMRPVLSHLAVRNGKVMAANGFLLGIADLPGATPEAPEGATPARPDELIHRKLARFLAGRIRRRSGLLDRIVWMTDRGLTWLDRGVVMSATNFGIDGTFPDGEDIVRKEMAKPEAAVFYTAPDLTLAAIETVIDFLGDSPSQDSPRIRWRVSGPMNAIVLSATRSDKRRLTVALMPMTIGIESLADDTEVAS